MPQFSSSVLIDCPQEKVFDFLTRTENSLAISPPDMAMRYLDVPETLSLGSKVEFELGGFGVPQRVHHEVSAFDRPRLFTESQVTGPLRQWVHQHILEAQGDKTLLTDQIEFEPPGGMIGFLITADRIMESLQKGFAHRHAELKRRLEQTA